MIGRHRPARALDSCGRIAGHRSALSARPSQRALTLSPRSLRLGGEMPAPRMVKCRACGHAISAAAARCPSCGHPRTASGNPAGVVVVLAILAGLGYYGWVKVTDFFTAPPTQDAPTQATQPAASDPDAPKVIAAQTYGCVTPQEFWRGKMLVIQNDREAFGEYLADAIARGRLQGRAGSFEGKPGIALDRRIVPAVTSAAHHSVM